MDYRKQMIVQPNRKVRMRDIDPGFRDGHESHETAQIELDRHLKRMARLQALLWAEKKRSVLIVLQALDAGGKDGAINHVFTAFNAQGTRVTGFKHPTQAEQDHDFLWRVHPHAPGKGEIAIFNRSHYEDVLFARVHGLADKETCKRRHKHIRGFESGLAESGTCIMKFFLHISKEEQAERLRARLKDHRKNWKFDPEDLKMRAHWEKFMRAYEDALNRCSPPEAPWHIIPANRKWYRDYVVAKTIVKALEDLNLDWPKAMPGLEKIRVV
jgi:PPK2 family polyphosphate:nucleotide phosphotransferase